MLKKCTGNGKLKRLWNTYLAEQAEGDEGKGVLLPSLEE